MKDIFVFLLGKKDADLDLRGSDFVKISEERSKILFPLLTSEAD